MFGFPLLLRTLLGLMTHLHTLSAISFAQPPSTYLPPTRIPSNEKVTKGILPNGLITSVDILLPPIQGDVYHTLTYDLPAIQTLIKDGDGARGLVSIVYGQTFVLVTRLLTKLLLCADRTCLGNRCGFPVPILRGT
jgi:hypothetical protein